MANSFRATAFAAMLFVSALAGTSANAEDFPARPVRIIVQAPAGSSPDVIARILADRLTNLWGQQVIVLNRPGGNGTIAARAAVTAAPDGYTIFMPAASIFISMPDLYPDRSFDVSRDLAPVGFVGEQPMTIAVSPSLGVNSLQELIALSQKQPGKINLASYPVGQLPSLTGELFRTRSGADITSVPYQGPAEAVSDLLSGRIQVIVDALTGVSGLVADRKLKILAFASEKRLPDFPDVPTVAEALPGSSPWVGSP
jgi:tripartite-type tricarboxylate transporter receptor subunit TctC